MHIIMSTPASLFFFFSTTFLLPSTLQQGTLPPKATNPERMQVLRDALAWMAFKRNGNLATDQDLEPFFEALKMNYINSKYFRTLIVAFRDGVLPRLTLNATDDCDHTYTLEYRDPFNKSVTYGQLKKFIFKSYDSRDESGPRQYCDYRKGLVCDQQTNKCGCPKGSKMGPISQGSLDQRCLMEENEICALIDLDHDPNSKYGALNKVLPEMLFNFEKPLSCKMGTQCRFIDNRQISPSCYNNNNGQWGNGRRGIDLGEECTLDLYTSSGPCRGSDIGNFPGYTCYNFGTVKPAVPTLVGLCAHDTGSYAITSGWSGNGMEELYWDNMFIGFVSPATTSLRGSKLRDYYRKYLDKVYTIFVIGGSWNTETNVVSGPCNVAKTEEMLDHWKFFINLEGSPPTGQDYVATEVELQNRLQKIADMGLNVQNKTCQVYSKYTSNTYIGRALRCVPNVGPPDVNGNDGKCERVPENEDMTWAWAQKFKEYRGYVALTYYERKIEDDKHRAELIGRVEMECDPKLGHPPGSQGAPKTKPEDNDVLEGGYCAPDRGCYTNYGDYLKIYDRSCNFKDSKGEKGLFRDCQWMDEARKFGKCEERKLDEEIKKELEKFSSSNGLGRGDSCDYDFEKKIRNGIRERENKVEGNKYKFLWKFQNIQYRIGSYNGFCDRTRLLECTEKGTCECVQDTAPRSVKYGGVEYMSDYCYVTSDYCYQYRLNTLYNAEGSSDREKGDIEKHYKGKQDDRCDGSNWCVYVAERKRNDYICTKFNTGSTGYIPEVATEKPEVATEKPEVATEKPGVGGGYKPKPPKCEDDPYCDYEDAGKGENQLHESLKMILIIVMMITI